MYLVTLPLMWLPSMEAVYKAWLIVNYGVIATGAWLLYRLAFPERTTWVGVTLFAALLLNNYPLYEALIQRNIELVEWLMVIVAMAWYARHWDGRAGAMVGMAARFPA